MKSRAKLKPAASTRKLFPRGWSRFSSWKDLVLSYEGRNEVVVMHPPDISPGGMFINTTLPFPESSILKVSFRLGRSNYLIQARCEVRYCLLGVGMGVEFIGLTAEDQKAIRREFRSVNNKRKRNRNR